MKRFNDSTKDPADDKLNDSIFNIAAEIAANYRKKQEKDKTVLVVKKDKSRSAKSANKKITVLAVEINGKRQPKKDDDGFYTEYNPVQHPNALTIEIKKNNFTSNKSGNQKITVLAEEEDGKRYPKKGSDGFYTEYNPVLHKNALTTEIKKHEFSVVKSGNQKITVFAKEIDGERVPVTDDKGCFRLFDPIKDPADSIITETTRQKFYATKSENTKKERAAKRAKERFSTFEIPDMPPKRKLDVIDSPTTSKAIHHSSPESTTFFSTNEESETAIVESPEEQAIKRSKKMTLFDVIDNRGTNIPLTLFGGEKSNRTSDCQTKINEFVSGLEAITIENLPELDPKSILDSLAPQEMVLGSSDDSSTQEEDAPQHHAQNS